MMAWLGVVHLWVFGCFYASDVMFWVLWDIFAHNIHNITSDAWKNPNNHRCTTPTTQRQTQKTPQQSQILPGEGDKTTFPNRPLVTPGHRFENVQIPDPYAVRTCQFYHHFLNSVASASIYVQKSQINDFENLRTPTTPGTQRQTHKNTPTITDPGRGRW